MPGLGVIIYLVSISESLQPFPFKWIQITLSHCNQIYILYNTFAHHMFYFSCVCSMPTQQTTRKRNALLVIFHYHKKKETNRTSCSKQNALNKFFWEQLQLWPLRFAFLEECHPESCPVQCAQNHNIPIEENTVCFVVVVLSRVVAWWSVEMYIPMITMPNYFLIFVLR